MISTETLKKCTCHILPATGSGTGIFVGADLVLTCRHVIPGLKVGDKVSALSAGKVAFDSHVIGICAESDLALLVTKEYSSDVMAELCDCEVVEGTEWACHGHPDNTEGRDVGMPLRGQIADNIPDSSSTIHDLTLTAEGQSLNASFKGFSGAGVINPAGQVVAIMRYKNISYLNGVSIRKAAAFLQAQKVHVKADELSDFTSYIAGAFGSFEEGIRQICMGIGTQISAKVSPQQIAEKLKGALFYPAEKGAVKDVITRLRKNAASNQQLWTGWMKFLTCVAVVKGAYEDVNKVTITLDSAQLSQIMNVELKPMTVPLTVSLNFFFTEHKQFFSITSEYIISRWLGNDMPHNSCHIFNSPYPDFGLAPMTAERKNKIIADITSPPDSGFIVPGKIDFGIISLSELNRQIANSQNVAEASQNLETLFKNALN